jgi:hypothetical protein
MVKLTGAVIKNDFGGSLVSDIPGRFRQRISHVLATYDILTQQKPKLKKLIRKLYVHP